MKTYSFGVQMLYTAFTTCDVQAESEEEARALVMADDNRIVWEGYTELGDFQSIVNADLTDEDDE